MATQEYSAPIPTRTSSPTLTDMAWLAGMLEGETAFQWTDSPTISVQMTDKDIIERIAQLLNDVEITPLPGRKEHYQPTYHTQALGSRAVEWMMTLYPFMGLRRREAIATILHRWNNQPGFPRGRRGERLPALCHPDRLRQGHGLCAECYQKAYVATYVLETKATCHPDRLVKGYGLCNACYLREYRKHKAGKPSLLDTRVQVPPIAVCHPDRPHFGKGFCSSCYAKQWRQEKAEAHLVGASDGTLEEVPAVPAPSVPIAACLTSQILTPQAIAWFAGLLDGEGSFVWRSSPCVKLKMTDHDVMSRAAILCGYALTSYQPKGKATYKRIYSLELQGFRATGWMMTLYPFMGIRRQEKIKELLQRWQMSAYFPQGHKGEELPALCHPEKQRWAKGLCKRCYQRAYMRHSRTTWKEETQLLLL